MAYKAGVPEEIVEQIKAKITNMDIDDFIEFYNTEKTFSRILDDYELLKLKAVGFTDDEKEVIQDNFEVINQLLDVYSK